MGKKSYKNLNYLLWVVLIGASCNAHAIHDNGLTQPDVTQNSESSQQELTESTKTENPKPVKKSKSQSSSLGVYKLLIPKSYK